MIHLPIQQHLEQQRRLAELTDQQTSPDYVISQMTCGTDVARLRTEYDETARLFGLANERLRSMLGRVYEIEGIIVANDESALLDQLVRFSVERETGRSFKTEGKSTAHLLVRYLVGGSEKIKSTRTHWVKALLAAAEAGVDRSADAFVSWVRSVGGIIKAGDQLSADSAPPPRTEPSEFRLALTKAPAGWVLTDPLLQSPGLKVMLINVGEPVHEGASYQVDEYELIDDANLIARLAARSRKAAEEQRKAQARATRKEEARLRRNAKGRERYAMRKRLPHSPEPRRRHKRTLTQGEIVANAAPGANLERFIND